MDRPRSSSVRRPQSSTRRLRRSSSFTSVRTSSPTGPAQPPEFEISCVSSISTYLPNVSRQSATRKIGDGASSRQAQLDQYKLDKEVKENRNDILEAQVLLLEAELSWAPSYDRMVKQRKNNETKRKIVENNTEIEMLVEFCSRVPLLLNAQYAVDQTQKQLDSVTMPSEERVKTLEKLVNSLERAQLVEGGFLLPEGDEIERLKPLLENLFSQEEQKALENAKIYAENMARLNETKNNLEAASRRLVLNEKEKEMWERHAQSLQESLQLLRILQEERHLQKSI